MACTRLTHTSKRHSIAACFRKAYLKQSKFQWNLFSQNARRYKATTAFTDQNLSSRWDKQRIIDLSYRLLSFIANKKMWLYRCTSPEACLLTWKIRNQYQWKEKVLCTEIAIQKLCEYTHFFAPSFALSWHFGDIRSLKSLRSAGTCGELAQLCIWSVNNLLFKHALTLSSSH